MRLLAVRRLVLFVPLMGLNSFACSSSGGHDSSMAQDGEVGALGLALQVAPGTTLDSVSYQITGPASFSRSGSIDVSSSTTTSAQIEGLPAGNGYSIALSGTSSDAAASCLGSATFNVIAGQTASIVVPIECREKTRLGSAVVNGALNFCPVVDGISANPSAVMMGNSLSLTSVVHDRDAAPAPLSYLWTATSGSFDDPTSANPRFTCATVGTVTVRLSVSDGDPDPGCAATLDATVTCGPAEAISYLYPGIKLIQRTDQLLAPARQAKMNLVFVNLRAPEVRFKFTPQGENLPPDNFGAAGWPTPYPAFEVVRQRTLEFLESAHGQVAINSHFFAPYPVPAGSDQGNYAYLIGLAASRGNVYSGFESPVQNYAIAGDAPAINIDRDNNASVVHRDPAFADGKHVLENVTLYNALAGSAQIITAGVKTVPQYKDATHPDAPLIPNGTYSNSNSWYNLVNARTAIGLTQDAKTVVLFTVDVRPTSGADRSQGMSVGEVADVLLGYGIWNALNLDGGGSTSMAMQDPVDNVRKQINVSSDSTQGRQQGSNLAVYSDDIAPATTAAASPPDASGAVTVALNATDLRNGMMGDLPGWVDRVHYSLSGAQAESEHVVNGSAASVTVTAPGTTTIRYFATDAAGNDESPRTLVVNVGPAAP